MIEDLYRIRQMIRKGQLKADLEAVNKRIKEEHDYIDSYYDVTYSPKFEGV